MELALTSIAYAGLTLLLSRVISYKDRKKDMEWDYANLRQGAGTKLCRH